MPVVNMPILCSQGRSASLSLNLVLHYGKMEKTVLLLCVLSGVGKCAQYPVRSLSANVRLG